MNFQDKLKRYDAIVALCDRFERKGKTMPYTSANGHMFSMLNKAGELGFRFSKDVQQSYIEEFSSSLFISHNAVLKGYVLIPEDMFTDLNLLARYLDESYDYVNSLKAK